MQGSSCSGDLEMKTICTFTDSVTFVTVCLRSSVMYDLQMAAKTQDAELKMKSDKDGQDQK